MNWKTHSYCGVAVLRVLIRLLFWHLQVLSIGTVFCCVGPCYINAFTVDSPTSALRVRLVSQRLLATKEPFEPEPCADLKSFFQQVGKSEDGVGDPMDTLQLGRSLETGQRGIFATEDIKQGDVLCRLPFDAAIVIESEESSDPERAYKFLGWQKSQAADTDSVYHPYLDLLPTSQSHFDPTPDFWTDEEIQALELPELVEEVLDRKVNLEAFVSSPENEKQYSLEDLQFASWLVKSRSFSILDIDDLPNEDENEAQVQCVLIPYVDMVNHASDDGPPNAQLQVHEDSSTGKCYYDLLATEGISKGNEVFLSYGTGEDETIDLLMNYGFVPTVNPFDVEVLEGDDFEWSTSTLEDETELNTVEDPIRQTILRLRIKLKRAMEGLQK